MTLVGKNKEEESVEVEERIGRVRIGGETGIRRQKSSSSSSSSSGSSSSGSNRRRRRRRSGVMQYVHVFILLCYAAFLYSILVISQDKKTAADAMLVNGGNRRAWSVSQRDT